VGPLCAGPSLFYEKILLNDKYYNKILNMNKDRNINVQFIVAENLLNPEIISFYNSWKNGYSFNNPNKKLPKNIKNVILKNT